MTYEIDAKGKKLGRVASEAASVLMGKDRVDFAKNKVAEEGVQITNASKLDMTAKKRVSKKYSRFSGYPSGLKRESMEEVIAKHGHSEVLRRAVKGMLPGNKLRDRRLNNLKIVE